MVGWVAADVPTIHVCCAQVIPPSWLRLFSPSELNQLLGGGEGGDIDVADMIRYTQYRWDVVHMAPNSGLVTQSWLRCTSLQSE